MGLPYKPAVTEDAVERIGGFGIPKLGDRGSIPGATGTVTLGADGQPVSYVVAAGDTYTGLTERFCLTPPDPYIEMVNSVRRHSGFSGDNMPPFALYAGDVINLDAQTVTSVGTENGRVLALTPTIYLPRRDRGSQNPGYSCSRFSNSARSASGSTRRAKTTSWMPSSGSPVCFAIASR